MMVRVLWTPRDCAVAIAGLAAAGPLPCRTVLVPRGSIAHSMRRELILAGRADVLAGARFALIPAAAAEVLRTAGIVFRPGEEALRATRLSSLFSDLDLVHFSLDLLRSTPGWDQAFARTISDLEAAGLGPKNLGTYGASQLRDVATVWRALDESAGRSWTIQRSYSEAAAVLERCPDLSPFQGPVLAFTTSELTAAEGRFLRAIPGATIGLLAARPARQGYLERIGRLLGAEAVARLRSAEAPRTAATERDLLASYLFEPPAVLGAADRSRSAGPDGTVDLEEHAGVEAELEATADWVARQVAEGTPLEDIAVLVPDLDPLAGLVAGRLARLPWHDGSFPVYVAGGLPLSDFAAGARALAVVRTLRAHLPVDGLAEVLPALRLAGDADRRLSRRAAVDLLSALGSVGGNPARPGGALEWSARVVARQGEFEERLSRIRADETAAAPEVRRLERLVADLCAVRPALEALVDAARAALEQASISALWPMVRDFLADWLLQRAAGPRAHFVLDESLGDLAADAACGRLAGDDALRIIEEAILATRVSAGRFGEPAVYVGALRAAVGLRFAAVRVIGLAEGHLPSMTREDPIIPHALRETLRDAGVPVATAADWALQNLHAFDAVVRNAERRIALSAPRLDVERSQREPSSVMLETAAALARPNSATGERNAVIPDRIALERDAFAPARARAECFRRELPLDEAAWHDGVARRLFGLPVRWLATCALDLDRILSEKDSSAMDGLLGASVSHLHVPGLSPDQPISVSAIQNLLGCPHAFLLGQVLRFDEPPALPAQREIGQPHYGHLFHTVAAEFYACHGPSFCARERKLADWMATLTANLAMGTKSFCARERKLADWMAVADTIVEREFHEFAKEYPLSGEAVRAQQRERLRRDVRELLEYDWRGPKVARFVAVERPFGQPIPVELRAGGGSLYVHGRVDRIDVENGRSLVRDLKTGRARFRVGKDSDPQAAVDVQIAVYGLVGQLLADEWKIPKPVAAAYAYIGRGAGERSFREDFHEVLEPAARKWLEIATGLLAKRLFPRTPDVADCTYCSFRPVCGDGAHERARALLSDAGGVLGDFAALKKVED